MIPRLIICEGVDGSGKSTLAQQIAEHYNGVYWHMTSGKGLCEHDAMALYQLDALKNAEVNIRQGKMVVFDRHWPSDQVYGTILRGRPSLEMGMMLERCKPMKPIYIYCYRNDPAAEHKKNIDPDHPYDEELFNRFVSGYEELFDELILHEIVNVTSHVLGYPTDEFIGKPSLTKAFIQGLVRLP